MESFWGALKTKLVHHRRFSSREQAQRETCEYIEIFYNRIRKQARLGYLSPTAFNRKYYAEKNSRLTRWTLLLTTYVKPISVLASFFRLGV